MADLLQGLNPAQLQAVTHDAGPLMVLAGPGTGKTRVITHRIAHLVSERGVRPDTIVALTYTVKAAAQLRERLASLIGPASDEIRAHTFHGLGLRILRRFADEADVRIGRIDDGRGGIIDSAQQTRLLRSIILENDLFRHARAAGLDAAVGLVNDYMAALADAAISPSDASKFCLQASERLRAGRGVAGEPLDDARLAAELQRVRMLTDAARAIDLFEAACRDRCWLTYADLISLPIRILKGSGRASAILRDEWRHMVVDEFQDVNAAQIELLRLLMPGAGKPDLCVVGDDDQSIYEFRGADDLAFAKFSRIWPGHATVRLGENYRSVSTIVRIANAIIGRAETRFDPTKTITPVAKADAPAAHPVECVQLEEEGQEGEVIAAMILTDRLKRGPAAKWSSYAVVVRSHLDADRIRAALSIEGVPTVAAREGTPAEDEGVKDILAWVELLASPHADHAAARILGRPPFSLDPRVVSPLRVRYRGELTRSGAGDSDTPDPGSFADWLAAHAPDQPAIARFAAMHAEFRRIAGDRGAADVIASIATAADPAHADLLDPRERADRVRNLVGMLNFVRHRQARLDAPGDIRAFWSYYQDLSPDEQQMRDPSLGSRVDGLSDAPDDEPADAVRLITAHSAKGLEFDTVFVPRVSPRHGYGAVREPDTADLPEGLVNRGDTRTPRQRAAAEARRLFYVACTRAERRLVLLSKKNKRRSSSTHYFEEIVFDPTCKDAISIIECRNLLQQAGELGLGAAFGWARPGSELDAATRSLGEDDRRDVFQRARRETRTAAAAALDLAAHGDLDAAKAAATRLSAAAMRLAALGHAERAGDVPAWAADHDAGAYAQKVLDEAGGTEDASPSVYSDGLKPPLRLSYTRVQDYLRCPRCFYAKHVLGLEELPGTEQVVGIAVHAALEAFYNEHRAAEADGRPVPTREWALETARKAFFRAWPRHLETDRAQLDQVLAQVGLVLDRLHDPHANVVEVEKRIDFAYGPHAFEAKIDRIDRITGPDGSETFRIVDYKTGKSSEKLRSPRPGDLQLGVYAMALNALYSDGVEAAPTLPGVAEYWIVSTGERGVIDLAKIDHAKVRAQLDEAIAGMIAGHWERSEECGGGCAVLGT